MTARQLERELAARRPTSAAVVASIRLDVRLRLEERRRRVEAARRRKERRS